MKPVTLASLAFFGPIYIIGIPAWLGFEGLPIVVATGVVSMLVGGIGMIPAIYYEITAEG